MRTRTRWSAAVAVLAALMVVAAACVPDPPATPTGPNPDDAPRSAEAAYTGPGPFAVGVTTLDLADRKVEVWYPSDPAAVGSTPQDEYFIKDFVSASLRTQIPDDVNPAFATSAHRGIPASDAGPFPLVLFSHGFASYRLQSTFLTTHLASWGFVVISPDYLERGLASVLGEKPAIARTDLDVAAEAIDRITTADDTPGGLLSGVVDTSSVYPIGHSAGGGTTLRLLGRPDVHSAIPMAAGVSRLSLAQGTAPALPPEKAVMWMGAQGDQVASIADVRTGFTYTAGPRKLVELGGSGHNTFDDICLIGGGGGVIGLALSIGLPLPDFLIRLGADGCYPPAKTVSDVWPEIRHFATAELRYRSGLDAEPVGLGSGVTAAFDDVAVYRHEP